MSKLIIKRPKLVLKMPKLVLKMPKLDLPGFYSSGLDHNGVKKKPGKVFSVR